MTSYGLFVDVGVTDGLVHRSEIAWEKGVDPTSLHPLGSVVKVVVIGVDRDRQRISLSIKRTGVDPWERYVNELETGQTVAATVTRVMPYGAFARLAEGVEGLIHGDRPGAAQAVAVCSLRRAHMKRCPEGGRVGFRTYNRNQMMPAPIYGLEEL